MNKIKIRKVLPKFISLLAIPFILSGCTEQSKCELPYRHVHLYTKQVNNTTLKTYLDNEKLNYCDYHWNSDCIEITNEDVAFYEFKDRNNLLECVDNWEYLYKVMASQHDYLEFYYYYTEDYYVSMTDADGNECGYWASDTHEGWDKDPRHQGVTGKVRVCHSRFFGYRILKKDGKYVLEKSKAVDDIRDVIDDYPYFTTDCIKKVTKEYDANENSLTKLKVEDLDEFTGPNLENKELYQNKK